MREYRIKDIVNPGIDFNGAGIEVPGPGKVPDGYNRPEWTGPTLSGLIVGLLRNLRPYGPQEGARLQYRRTMTIVSRQIDHLTFNVIIAG